MPSPSRPVLMPISYTAQASSLPLPGLSPIRLRAAAHLYGIETIPLTHARVLEIGCGAGQYVLSFALAYPEASAVGLCTNEAEAQAARNLAEEAKAHNVRFLSMELMQIDATLGEFDYVMARGLYETLPGEAATFLLRTCESLLSPLGLLCLDYPVYPGAKAFEIVRDAMLMHCHDNEDPNTLLEQARAALVLFNEGIAPDNPMGPALKQAAATLDAQLQRNGFATVLGAQGTPTYFLEFANQALQTELACVGDAEPMLDIASHWGSNVGMTNSVLSIGQTGTMRLQYLDLATGRAKRHTLLVKAARNTGLRDRPVLDRLSDFRWAGGWERASWALPDTDGRADFQDHRGRRWTSPDANCTLILDTLAQAWPITLSFHDLADAISAVPSESSTAANIPDPIVATQSALRIMLNAGIIHYCLGDGPYDTLKNDVGLCVPGLTQAALNLGANAAANSLSWPVINLWQEPIANIFTKFGLQLLPQLSNGAQAEHFISAANLGASFQKAAADLREVSSELCAELLRQLHSSAALHISLTSWFDLLEKILDQSTGQIPCWSLYLAAKHTLRNQPNSAISSHPATSHSLTPQQQGQIQHLTQLIERLSYTAAEPVARQIIKRLPNQIEGPAALVRCLSNTGRHHEALALLQSMLDQHSSDSRFIRLLIITLTEAKEHNEAMRFRNIALIHNPEWSDALNAMGLTCMKSRQLQIAETYFRLAITVAPSTLTASLNLISLMTKQGRVSEGITLSRYQLDNPISTSTDYRAAIYSNLLFLANYDATRSAEDIRQYYQQFEDELCRPLYAKWRSHKNNRNPNRRLRIGYVSADFRKHAVNRFLLPIFEHHDRSAFEIYAYSNVASEDSTTTLYRKLADAWVPITGVKDDEAVARIRSDAIDILIDLSGHTGGNRLGIFAQKPAPISVSWLGYGYTSGISAIDYFLGNVALCPEDSEHLFAETPWRLPRAAHIYRPSWDEMGDPSPLPVLNEGRITLVSLSRSIRINDRVTRIWADILLALPNSRLVINSEDYGDQATCEALIARFVHYGVAAERLMLGYTSPPWHSLKHADIGLDCFPHNAGTTLLDMLCMGVPYVTLADRPSVGRLGAANLHAIGHPEWIAHNEQEYVDKVIALAGDTATLAKIREALPNEVKNSSATNEVEFTHDLEDAYRTMFQKWVDSKSTSKN